MNRNNNHILLLMPSAAAFMLILIATINHGVGIYPDSMRYIAVARNIADGNGIVNYKGVYDSTWPPLYPIVLWLSGLLARTDPFHIAGVLNALIHAANVYLAGNIALKLLPSSPRLVLAGCFAIAFSVPLLWVSIVALSEPLFILLTMLAMQGAFSLLEKESLSRILWLSLVVGLASLTRYIGIILIFWGALSLLLVLPGRLTTRLWKSLLFAAAASVPLAILLAINFLLTEAVTGDRNVSDKSFTQNVSLTFRTLGAWYFTERLVPITDIGAYIENRRTLSTVLFALPYLVLGGMWYFRHHNSRVYRVLLMLVLFMVLYTSFLITMATFTEFNPIDHRLLSPVAIPLTLAALIATNFLYRRLVECGLAPIATALLAVAAALGVLYPLVNSAKRARDAFVSGVGHSHVSWTSSPTLRALREDRQKYQEAGLYTNGDDVVYFLAGLQATSVGKVFTAPPQGLTHGRYLVWLDRRSSRDATFLQELEDAGTLELVSAYEDGVIYRVTEPGEARTDQSS